MRISDWSSDVCSSDLISSVSHSSVILDSFLESADQLGEKQGEGEKQDGQRPEIRHQEGAGKELEQLAIADDRHQELTDDHALDPADEADADTGEDLRQRRPDDDLDVESQA